MCDANRFPVESGSLNRLRRFRDAEPRHIQRRQEQQRQSGRDEGWNPASFVDEIGGFACHRISTERFRSGLFEETQQKRNRQRCPSGRDDNSRDDKRLRHWIAVECRPPASPRNNAKEQEDAAAEEIESEKFSARAADSQSPHRGPDLPPPSRRGRIPSLWSRAWLPFRWSGNQQSERDGDR